MHSLWAYLFQKLPLGRVNWGKKSDPEKAALLLFSSDAFHCHCKMYEVHSSTGLPSLIVSVIVLINTKNTLIEGFMNISVTFHIGNTTKK